MKNIPQEVWKWLAVVFFGLVVSMGAYIYRMENRVEDQILMAVATELSKQLEPMRVRVQALELYRGESRVEYGDIDRRVYGLESQYGAIDARLKSIDDTQIRILNRLESIR